MEQLELREVIVLGASIGGWLALEIAVRNASRMRALAVAGASGIHVPGLRKGDLFLWSPEQRARNLVFDQALAERALAHAPSAEETDRALKNQFTLARLAWEPRLFDPHLHKWLHRIQVPTLVVWGAEDKLLPAGYAAEYGRLIPRARVEIVPQCGHLPHIEQPQAFTRLFRAFTAQVPR
jgi:pimeloyl-ACP methyl ester carboxylesterase